ncbi:YjdF family protein [Enterococcus sp. LJL51]|uniref:YjdF family protein n=1 Tax=Enterococcus sp. LJL51 TaxID=3416656 RepID=UPI003CF35BE9
MELTIYFNGQYWSGLVEYVDSEQHLRVYQHIFGSEPKDEEVYQFVITQLPVLLEQEWHSQIKKEQIEKKPINPKRIQRMIEKQKRQPILSTKSQAAIAEQQESLKLLRKQKKRKRTIEKKQQIFEKKQEKRLEKRKGH